MSFADLSARDLVGVVATLLIFFSQGIEIWAIVVTNFRPKLGVPRVAPSRSSFWLWSVVQAEMAFFYAQTGETFAVGVSIAYAITMLVIALLSVPWGFKEWHRTDTMDMITAVGSTIVCAWWWQVSHNPIHLLVFAVLLDFLGVIRTLRKAWAVPESESALAWAITVPACLLNFAAVTSWDIGDLVYQPYLLLVNSAIAYAIWRKRLVLF